MTSVKVVSDLNDPQVVDCLKNGGIVAARTDTIYGLLGSADNQATVERIYQAKSRNPQKSPIVLIADRSQLYDQPTKAMLNLFDQEWPGPVSIILPSTQSPTWLRRDNNSLAYRLPDHRALRDLIDLTGRLIAPSANPEGDEPAMNLQMAIDYFADLVDIYVDGGTVDSNQPSKLIKIIPDGSLETLRWVS